MNENLNITFRIEGTARENGHVTLSDFLVQMNLFLKTLQRFDAITDDAGKTRVYYRIVNAFHNSPLTIELEPVPLETEKPASFDRIKEGHDRYFQELTRIQKGEAPSADVDQDTLEILRRLAFPKAKSIEAQIIHNSGAGITLDANFRQNLQKMLGRQAFSIGSLTGSLDALDFHGDGKKKKFWIYPITGPRRVQCKFPPGEDRKVKELLEKHVTVYGVKYFRANSMHPHLIEVRDFHEVKPVDRSDLMERIHNLRKKLRSAPAEPEIDFAHEW